MNTWKVILATLVIFGTGVVTGGLLVTHNERTKQRQFWLLNRAEKNRAGRPEVREPNPPPPGAFNPAGESPGRAQNLLPSMLRMDLLQRIERQISLTPTQREKIEDILSEGQEHTQRIMEPVQAELKKQMQNTRSRIREVLTEDQQRRFDELMRPQRRFDESMPPDRRTQRPQFRPPEGQQRNPDSGPRAGEPAASNR